MIIVPTAEDLARANAEFDRDWGGVDDVYYRFCVRFWRLLEACRSAGREVSVKSLDTHLWSVPTSG